MLTKFSWNLRKPQETTAKGHDAAMPRPANFRVCAKAPAKLNLPWIEEHVIGGTYHSG